MSPAQINAVEKRGLRQSQGPRTLWKKASPKPEKKQWGKTPPPQKKRGAGKKPTG